MWEVVTFICAEVGVAVEKSVVKELLNLRKNLFLNTDNAPAAWVSSISKAASKIEKIAGNYAGRPDEFVILKKELDLSKEELQVIVSFLE